MSIIVIHYEGTADEADERRRVIAADPQVAFASMRALEEDVAALNERMEDMRRAASEALLSLDHHDLHGARAALEDIARRPGPDDEEAPF